MPCYRSQGSALLFSADLKPEVAMLKRLFMPILAVSSLLVLSTPSNAQETTVIAAPSGESHAQMPSTAEAAPFRLIPVAGASSFQASNRATLNNFNEGYTAGILADFGPGALSFETGGLILSTETLGTRATESVRLNNWGIPLLAKFNFSGKPHETIFLKAGGMPMFTTGAIDEFNVMGVAGVGGAIKMSQNSSFVIDATYNRLLTQSNNISDYQGVTFLGGLQFDL